MYKWKTLVFTYKSTSSDVISSTSGALGTVTLSSDYNALDGGYTDLREMNNAEYSNSQRPSTSFMHAVDCRKFQQKAYYVRSGPPPESADLRLYDGAITTLATSGMAVAGGGIGQLWVTYTCEFIKPIFHSDLSTNTQVIYQKLPDTCATYSAPNFAMLGALTSLESVGNVGCTITYPVASPGAMEIAFPPESAGKSYLITYFVKSGVAAANNQGYFSEVTSSSSYGTNGKILVVPNSQSPPADQYGVGAGSFNIKSFTMYVYLGAYNPAAPYKIHIKTNNPVVATYWPLNTYQTAHLTITGLDPNSLSAFM